MDLAVIQASAFRRFRLTVGFRGSGKVSGRSIGFYGLGHWRFRVRVLLVWQIWGLGDSGFRLRCGFRALLRIRFWKAV